MPTRAPRICQCGRVISAGQRCKPCEKRYEAQRSNAHERGYDYRWRKAAKEFLSRHLYCAHCPEYAEVVDHIIPHKGDAKLFWDQKNWQPLCRHCHNSRKQALEHRNRSRLTMQWGSW